MSRTNGSSAVDGRLATLDKTIDSLTKRFGEGTIMRLGDAHNMNVQTIPTGSISLDIALGVGGVPRGRIIEIYGPESSGKIKAGNDVVGNRTRVKVKKNKVAAPFTECEFDIMYNEGISRSGDVIDLATTYNIVDKRGAYFRYNDVLLGQGRENAKVYLTENPAVLADLERKIRGEARLAIVKMEDEVDAAEAGAEPAEF